MKTIEFIPRYKRNLILGFFIFALFIIGFPLLALQIRQFEFTVIAFLISAGLFIALVMTFKNGLIKNIVFTDKITINYSFGKQSVLQYHEVIDVGTQFIKTKKHRIPLVHFQNSNELVNIFMEKVKDDIINPAEDHHAKQVLEAGWIAAASVIAYILYILLAIFIPIPIKRMKLKFLVIYFPLLFGIFYIIKFIETKKQSPRTKRIDQAYHFLRLGKLEEALVIFQEALELEPDNAIIYLGKGLVLQHKEQFNESLTLFDKAIELEPKYAAAYLNKANSLLALKREEAAIQYYDKAYKLDKELKHIFYNKAVAAEQKRDLEQALTNINSFIKAEPKEGAGYYFKSIVLSQLDRRSEALAALKKAVKLAPELTEAAGEESKLENIKHELEFRNLIQ